MDAHCSHKATRKRKCQVSVFRDGTNLRESSYSDDDSQQTSLKAGKEGKRDGRFRANFTHFSAHCNSPKMVNSLFLTPTSLEIMRGIS